MHFGLGEGEIMALLRITKHSFIKTFGWIVAILASPIALAEAADGDMSEYREMLRLLYFFDYKDDKGEDHGKFEIDDAYKKAIEDYRKILIKKDPAKYKNAEILTPKGEIRKFFRENFKPISPGGKFKFFGANTEIYVDTVIETNEIILNMMEQRVDMGNIKFKLSKNYIPLTSGSVRNNTRRYQSKANINIYNNRRRMNQAMAENENIALTMMQIETQENLEREMKALRNEC